MGRAVPAHRNGAATFQSPSKGLNGGQETASPLADASPLAGCAGGASRPGEPQRGGDFPVAVPEPSIACMALLGIGMMIKRRRA